MNKKFLMASALQNKFIGCVLLIAGVGAISLFGQTATPNQPASAIVNDNYRIGPGDVIDIVVAKNADLSRTGVRISDRGTLQLSMLDEDIPAACMTERQLANQIKEKYKKYILNPFINVAVREFNANPVAFIGSVNSPGRFQVQRPTKVLELLALVNGPSPSAGSSIEIIRTSNRPYCDGGTLVRNPDAGEDIILLPLAETLKGVETANPVVRPGDILRVTELVEVKKVNAYIQGNVKSSMAISLADPVTLSQAVAMAGGLAPDAEAEKIIIRRSVPNSINRSAIVVNLKAINQGKRDDILLEANDIVDVPGPTGGKKVLKKLMDSFIPSIISLPTRVIY